MKIQRNKSFNVYAIVPLVLTVLLSSPNWAGPRPVTDYLKETLDQMIEVLNDPSFKTPDKQNEKKDILLKLIKERFDEEEFARRALGAHWQKRTQEEKQEFVKIFSDLLERTYLDKIDAYLAKAGSFSEKNILYLNETVKGSYVVVATKIITNEDTEIPVLYLFKNKQGNWLVCDVAIEGVSIAKNYRAQFNEILANSSFKELIAKLKSKQQTELTEQKK
ncbi:MAG: ABC transporter substrate-binding protein [Deltaproteobacteria bacterium]|nr:MAG: ABC transporter substrate-binding protein [Deltaproteobacteria bacterium]